VICRQCARALHNECEDAERIKGWLLFKSKSKHTDAQVAAAEPKPGCCCKHGRHE
jgi:hypothetical protein